MSLLLNGDQVTERQRADLVRMAAAWNASEGISTENLEENGPFLQLILEYGKAKPWTEEADPSPTTAIK